MTFKTFAAPLALATSLAACATTPAPQSAAVAPAAPVTAESEAYPLTPAGAAAFIDAVEKDLFDFSVEHSRILWVNNTYINDTTDALAATYASESTTKDVTYAIEAARYAAVPGLDPEVKRKLNMLSSRIVMPAATTVNAADELSRITTRLKSDYGKGQGTLNGRPLAGVDIEAEMGKEHTPAEYAEMWTTWHDTVGGPSKDRYVRMVELGNAGARELGYSDVGNLWRANYDMPPEEFAALTEKMWQEVKPLYQSLHTYVRWNLNEKYGDAVQPKTGPIRADLLGNLWAQEWGNIYPLVAPEGTGDIGYDLTELLEESGKSEVEIVKIGEGFFSSLGFEPLPETFWERSMFIKPADREVVCHASAWNVDNVDDLRIKMCIKKNADDFTTVHHELGHNYYQRAYNQQDYLHLDGANDGFHEAIGDMIALSITPAYLVQIGLLDESQVPSADKDIGLLLRKAMDKIAFLPFGLLIDRYRWGIFDGTIAPAQYNDAWNQMRLEYQGIKPPVERPSDGFDAGAKYHIPANTPYTRYFLARLLQFQFYKAACDQAGWTGPLHRCSFYGNEEVGRNLNAMLEMGASKPWPEALEAFTGEREMSGKAMVEYFAPLKAWLDEQNRGKPSGW